MIPQETLAKEIGRLEKLGRSVRDLQASVPWKCPCCGANCVLVGACMKRGERGRWRHKHRIYNLDREKFEGGWQ